MTTGGGTFWHGVVVYVKFMKSTTKKSKASIRSGFLLTGAPFIVGGLRLDDAPDVRRRGRLFNRKPNRGAVDFKWFEFLGEAFHDAFVRHEKTAVIFEAGEKDEHAIMEPEGRNLVADQFVG